MAESSPTISLAPAFASTFPQQLLNALPVAAGGAVPTIESQAQQ